MWLERGRCWVVVDGCSILGLVFGFSFVFGVGFVFSFGFVIIEFGSVGKVVFGSVVWFCVGLVRVVFWWVGGMVVVLVFRVVVGLVVVVLVVMFLEYYGLVG